MRIGANGVVLLHLAHGEIVGVNVLARRNFLCGESDDLVELSNRLTGCQRVKRQLVSGRDIGDGSDTKFGQELASLHGLKGDENIIVRAEFENLGHSNR